MQTRKEITHSTPLSRKRKLVLNISMSLVFQLLSIVSGMILPKFFLSYYGSTTNGLINSISQFLSYIALLDLGVGAVFQSALYKPLAEKNRDKINEVFCSGRQFYKKIGIVIFIYVLILTVGYPFIVESVSGYWSTFLLILAMSISVFAQYYLGLAYQLFLTADQKHYVQSVINATTLIINTICTCILIKIGCNILIVKLSTSAIFLLRPFLLKYYVDKHYQIDYHCNPPHNAIPQKWNGFSQHLAAVVLDNTDIAVLTFFSTMINVSIYSVYYMIVNAIKQVITLMGSAVTSTLGNIYGLGEKEKFISSFEFFEWIIQLLTTFLFSITGILIVPFVSVYTNNITDANYIVPMFGAVIVLAFAMTTYQLPYKIMIQVIGHYKQTQMSSFIEAGINLVVSVVTVFKFGLIGVAVGTFVSMLYRLIYLMFYIHRHVYKRSAKDYSLLFSSNVITVIGTVLLSRLIQTEVSSYGEWILVALQTTAICLVVLVIVNLLLYFEKMKLVFKFIKEKAFMYSRKTKGE